VPPRQHVLSAPPQLLAHAPFATAKTAGRLAVSEVYFVKARALIDAFTQLKSHGLQESPSETPTQSVSTMHDWS
jgi:hypothetical protein